MPVQVTNRGPSDVSRSTLIIEWPQETGGSEVGSGKFLLYLMQAPIVSTGLLCHRFLSVLRSFPLLL